MTDWPTPLPIQQTPTVGTKVKLNPKATLKAGVDPSADDDDRLMVRLVAPRC